MKTKNLTPWCNLYSVGLKFNIEVKTSRYKTFVYGFIPLLLCAAIFKIIFIVSDLPINTWLMILMLLVIYLFCAGVFFSLSLFKNLIVVEHRFILQEDGFCNFIDEKVVSKNLAGNDNDLKPDLQLQRASRVGFYGCWLSFKAVDEQKKLIKSGDGVNKYLFIFKDSLSKRDYSRLCRVINHIRSSGLTQ